MDTATRLQRVLGWALVLVLLVGAAYLIRRAGSEWSEAIVQALAALGGLAYWASRSRSRVALRLKSSNGLYLELVNVGNRVAKRVEMTVDPPIPWESTLTTAPRAKFGPVEDFGDMDQGQRYVIFVGSPSPHTVDVLDATTFVVSYESTWGFRRRTLTMRFGGSGGRSDLGEGAATTIGEIAETLKNQEKTLKKVERTLQTVGNRLPSSGGRDKSAD